MKKKESLNCRVRKPKLLFTFILICLFSGSLSAQKSSLDSDLTNIERSMPALASINVLEKGQLSKPFDVTVSGTVTDKNGEPIPGATISVPGTGIGTATDLEGKYMLTVPEGSTLVFSFIGFETQTIGVGDQSIIDVTLAEDMGSLDEVVVMGYGVQKRVNVIGSVTAI